MMTKGGTSFRGVAPLLLLLLFLCQVVESFLPSQKARTTSTTTTTSLYALSVKPEDVLVSSNLPGNFGFDPLHLAQTQQQLITYRKAEMKHARLAMLAVVAILWSDLQCVDRLGATHLLEGRAFPEFLGACVGLPVALELYAEQLEQEHNKDDTFFPGNLDLDPFHLYPASTKGQRQMQFVEIMAGRVCMIAAAGRLTQNLLVQLGVLGEQDSLLTLLMPSTTAETVEAVVEEAIV